MTDLVNRLESAVYTLDDHDSDADYDDDRYFSREFYTEVYALIAQGRQLALNFTREIDGTEQYEQIAANPPPPVDEPPAIPGAPVPGGADVRAARAGVEAIRARIARMDGTAAALSDGVTRHEGEAEHLTQQTWEAAVDRVRTLNASPQNPWSAPRAAGVWHFTTALDGSLTATQQPQDTPMELADTSIEAEAEAEMEAETVLWETMAAEAFDSPEPNMEAPGELDAP